MPDLNSPVYAILLAGGTGTRLWPVSRERFPKQLVNFIGRDSLVQSTIKRLAPVIETDKIKIVCGNEHANEITRHMEDVGIPSNGKILCEPCGRNTAPAILLSIFDTLKREENAVLCIFPADHVIDNIEAFHDNIESAVHLAEQGHIVTFGIRPHYPETGYGYIEGAETVSKSARYIKRFVEKPDRETAETYIKAGNFFWNSGMFTFKLSSIIDEFKVFQPELFHKMETILSINDPPSLEDYQQLANISIDYAIMEKTKKGVVLPADFGWSDIGSWKSLYDFLQKDANNNVINGDVIAKDTTDSLVMAHDRLIATNRIDNMVIVDTPDAVFVADITSSQDVKDIVTQLKETGRKEYYEHTTVHHEWGSRTVLEQNENYRIDRLTIHPGVKYTLDAEGVQKKHITIIKGEATLITDDRTVIIKTGESSTVTENEEVTLKNPGNVSLGIIQITISGQTM